MNELCRPSKSLPSLLSPPTAALGCFHRCHHTAFRPMRAIAGPKPGSSRPVAAAEDDKKRRRATSCGGLQTHDDSPKRHETAVKIGAAQHRSGIRGGTAASDAVGGTHRICEGCGCGARSDAVGSVDPETTAGEPSLELLQLELAEACAHVKRTLSEKPNMLNNPPLCSQPEPQLC